MKLNPVSLKEKIKKSKVLVGGWITMADGIVPEIMAQAGFEWLAVDMEHSALTLEQVQNQVRVIELSGVPSLVRVGENNPNLIKRVMDTGTQGVIVPMVNSRAEAVKAVQSVHYPTRGIRGVGLARAQKYGFSFSEYRQWLKQKSVVIVQIEHIRAVENIDEILQVEGIDAFIVGPMDLSGSLGFPGEMDHPKVVEALKVVMNASKRFNIPAGFHVIPPDTGLLTAKVRQGYKFLAFSLDILLLGTVCRNSLAQVKKSLNRNRKSLK